MEPPIFRAWSVGSSTVSNAHDLEVDVNNDEPSEQPDGRLTRRTLLKAAVGAGIGLAVVSEGASLAFAEDATEPASMPPQKGDYFVFADGTQKGELVTSEAIPLGGPPVRAWPVQVSGDAATPTIEVVRDGSTNNEVLLARFELDQYSPSTKNYVTPEGVVAYAATCTHQCCIVTDWNEAEHLFHCPCHGSEFDPLNNAQQTPTSPAPRPLPQLALKPDAAGSGYPTVAAKFRTQVGCGPGVR